MSREITRTFTVYTFDELNDNAKDKVREYYGECREAYFFTEDCEMYLKWILPNSNLKVYYSLGYCQSDYFTMVGVVSLSDVLDKIAENYTDKEIKYLRWLIREWCGGFTIRGYGRDSHFCEDSVDFATDVIYDMECNNIRGIRHELIENFEGDVYSYLDDIRANFERDGYAYFYEYTDEDIEDWCDCNEFEFLEDGELFA